MKTFHIQRTMLLLAVLCMSIATAKAESDFERNMRIGKMFETSGNLTMADKYYTSAAESYDRNDERQLVMARLAIVDINKFRNPVFAQRLNDQCEFMARKHSDLRQKHIVLNAFIAFCLQNKSAFEQANNEYIKLCHENESLPDSYDAVLQAMGEAVKGFYDDALSTLQRSCCDLVTKQDIRIKIFSMKGELNSVIREQQRKAAMVDSLVAETYTMNNNEVSVSQGIDIARQQSASSNKKLWNTILLLTGIIIIFIAIYFYIRSKQKKYEKAKNDQLLTALKMANESDGMKREFVRRISHEIRTPLNAITGFNEVLNNTEIEIGKEERSELMKRINENVKAITVIVDELLQAANAESMHDYAKFDTVMCNQFFSDLLYKHTGDVSSKIELKYTTKVVNRFSFVTNADALEKIVDHLIDNAIKFTHIGRIELSCSVKDNTLVLSLTDTGKGIPADKQDDIFEDFAKADQFQQGIGLGLSVSRKMAHRLGGNLVLDKNYTTGARFILTLPLK